MSLSLPKNTREDFYFTQFCSGYMAFGVTKTGKIKQEFNGSDGSEMRLHIGDERIPLNTSQNIKRGIHLLRKKVSPSVIARLFDGVGVYCEDFDGDGVADWYDFIIKALKEPCPAKKEE